MPNPSNFITRSSSSTKHNLRLQSRIQCSNRSSCSAPPTPKSGPTWRLKNKVKSLFSPARRNGAELSNNSDTTLTEETLQEHNRRHECSPYYKGLTDSSLALNQFRMVGPAGSPGHDSHATTLHTSATSLSSFIVLKVKEFGSCISMTSYTNKKRIKAPTTTTTTPAPAPAPAPTTTTLLKEMGGNIPKHNSTTSRRLMVVKEINKEKPLRERVSQQQFTHKLLLHHPAAPPSLNNNNNNNGDGDGDPVEENPILDATGDAVITEGNKAQFVWASRYRPQALKDFICNRDIAISLQGQAKHGDCGHFIFQGQPGVGKRTMIWAMLREFFGPHKVQTRVERKVFELKGDSGGSIEVLVGESAHHVEVSVAELKGYEKHIIVELIKQSENKSSVTPGYSSCLAIILYEADRLSMDALLYINWMLEKCKNTKVFFCCSDVSKLQPIRNLCTVLHLNPPSREEIVRVLEFIAEQEGIHLPQGLAEKFADGSKNNLRQAIRSFEATWHKSYPFTEDQVILSGWDDDIAMIAKSIIEEQSPRQLYEIRVKLLTLFEHDVCPYFIFETLVQELKKHPLTEPLLQLVDCSEYAAGLVVRKPSWQDPTARTPNAEMEKKQLHDPLRTNFEHLLSIEEFIARFMSIYKTYHKTRIKDEVVDVVQQPA